MAEKRGKESRIKGNSLGASGFTIGVLSILSFGWIGLIMAVVGFVFCLIQQMKKPTKLAKAGLILNVIGFIASIVWIVYLAPQFADWLEQLNTFPTA
jgi:apolipoprotein N-acyltransferase